MNRKFLFFPLVLIRKLVRKKAKPDKEKVNKHNTNVLFLCELSDSINLLLSCIIFSLIPQKLRQLHFYYLPSSKYTNSITRYHCLFCRTPLITNQPLSHYCHCQNMPHPFHWVFRWWFITVPPTLLLTSTI